MMQARRMTRYLTLALVGGLLAAACSTSTGDATVSTTQSTEGSDSTVADTPVVILPGEPIVDGFPTVKLSGPGSTGAGEYPLFGWEAVSGATTYQLVVSGPSGPTWAWEGPATEIRYGAVDSEPPAGYGGPRLTEPSCWSVVALDADSHAVAASGVVPVSPGSEPAQTCAPGGRLR
jgi:hypothetical protein